jgi:hypothetical protein
MKRVNIMGQQKVARIRFQIFAYCLRPWVAQCPAKAGINYAEEPVIISIVYIRIIYGKFDTTVSVLSFSRDSPSGLDANFKRDVRA